MMAWPEHGGVLMVTAAALVAAVLSVLMRALV